MNDITKDLEKIRQELEVDYKKYFTNVAKYMAIAIADDMTDEACHAIEDFYAQYDPEDLSIHNGHIYYYRNWNFRKSYKRYYENKSTHFIGGVRLLKDEIPNVYKGKNSSPAAVFDRVYLGYHGIASFQDCNPLVPILKPSPIRRINEKYRHIVNNLSDYERNASIKAQKDSYIRIFK